MVSFLSGIERGNHYITLQRVQKLTQNVCRYDTIYNNSFFGYRHGKISPANCKIYLTVIHFVLNFARVDTTLTTTFFNVLFLLSFHRRQP